MAQSNPNWKAHIVGDSVDNDMLNEIHLFLNLINDKRIRFTNLPDRHNDWGHTPRQYGVDNSTSEWVIMTGEDNYYVPEFVDLMLIEAKNQHFVYCDMVHNWTDRQYYPVKTNLEFGKIDIGCFMVKTNMAQKIKLKVNEEWADWYFVQEFMNKFKHANVKKVNKMLYVHN